MSQFIAFMSISGSILALLMVVMFYGWSGLRTWRALAYPAYGFVVSWVLALLIADRHVSTAPDCERREPAVLTAAATSSFPTRIAGGL